MGTSDTGSVLSASAFVESLGINTHAAYGWGSYDDASLMIDDLRYLGVTTLRDTFTADPAAAPVLDALAAAGYKFDLVVPSDVPALGAAGLQQFLASVDALGTAHPGSVVAIEGLNEANIQGFSYNGSSSMAAAAQFQSALYSAVESDGHLTGVAVYNMTLGLNDASDYAALGNLAGSADYANAHAYVATSTPESYGLAVSLGLADQAAVGRPTVITESGYTTLSSNAALGVDQTAQAKSILTSVVEAFKDGVSQNYLYELLDTNAGSTDPEAHFGLFNSDGSPKLAATAIHNLTSILADDGTGGHEPTAALGYTLSGLPSGGDSMVLAKTNGAYDLVVWAERQVWDAQTQQDVINPAQSVIVQLDGVHSSVVVYDPLDGTRPIASYTNVQTFQIPISDHPLIIEIDAPHTTAVHALVASAPVGRAIVETSAQFVAQMSELAADGTVTSVALTDTHVLTVASEATMDYMISHYGAVLSAVTGGFSFAVTESAATWSQTNFYTASGSLTSNEQTAYVNGVIGYDLVTNVDGSTASSNYVDGVKTHMTVTYADHSQDYYTYGITGQTDTTEMDHFDSSSALVSTTLIGADGGSTTDQFAAGQLVSETVSDMSGASTTSVYSAGFATKVFVNHADGTHDFYLYDITGQSYTTQVQHLNSSGVVTSVERSHSDGSLDYRESRASDGTLTSTQFDAHGVETSQAVFHADGSKDVYAVNITGATYSTALSEFDATGKLSLFETFHADGTPDSKVTLGASSQDAIRYDSHGVIVSEVVSGSDGSSATSFYQNGTLSSKYVTNTDGSHDAYGYNLSGEYADILQHSDASGRVTSATRTHTDGTLDYQMVTNPDGSVAQTYYDAHGVKDGEILTASSGVKDVFGFHTDGSSLDQTYTASGVLQKTDAVGADGSHTVTADIAGATLTGGSGNDTFFSAGSTIIQFSHGTDLVFNFHAGAGANADTIDVSKSLVSDFSHLQTEQVGDNTLIHLTSTDTITLEHVQVAALGHENFFFV